MAFCRLLFWIAIILSVNSQVINSQSADNSPAGEFICPDGWQRVPAVNVSDPELFRWAACVLKSDAMAAPLTWDEALADCRGQSAHLLVLADEFYDRYTDPNSVADHGLLAIGHQLVKFVNSTGHYGGFSEVWVGLHGTSDNSAWWEADVPIVYKGIRASLVRTTIGPYDQGHYASTEMAPQLYLRTWWNTHETQQQQQQQQSVEVGGRSCGAAVIDVVSQIQFGLTMTSCDIRKRHVCVKSATHVLLSQELALNMKVTASSLEAIYLDGVSQRFQFGVDGNPEVTSIVVPRSVEVIAVSAATFDFVYPSQTFSRGWIAAVVTGFADDEPLRTDSRWKCINPVSVADNETFWTRTEFNDSSWPAAYKRYAAETNEIRVR